VCGLIGCSKGCLKETVSQLAQSRGTYDSIHKKALLFDDHLIEFGVADTCSFLYNGIVADDFESAHMEKRPGGCTWADWLARMIEPLFSAIARRKNRTLGK
jgi:hypothetical protein